MAVVVGKILGRLTDGWWGQVHDFIAEGERAHKRGRLMACASLYQPQLQEMAAVETGREILTRLHELYYGNLETDPLTALRQTVSTIGEEFADCEIVALANLEDALYVVVRGCGGVWIRKPSDQEGWIVDPNLKSQNSKTVAMSGWLKSGQTVVAGNSRFWQAITLGTVRAAAANSSHPVELAEGLATVVHGSDTGIGGVGIVVQQMPKLKQIEVSKISPTTTWRTSLFKFIPKPTGPIFISSGDKNVSRRRNMYMGIGFLVFLLLLVGGWQWRQMYIKRLADQHNSQIEELIHNFNEAQALVELNPVRSRQLLVQVGTELQRYKGTKKKDERLQQIEASFDQVLGTASGVKPVTPEEILDLGWLRPSMTGNKLAWLDGELVVLDTSGDRLVIIDPVKKSGSVIAGQSDLGQAQLVAGYPGKIEILSDKGIVECSIANISGKAGSGSAGQCSVKITVEEIKGEIRDMKMFAGNIYLLSTGGIWRYQVTDTGFGMSQSWLASSEDISVLTTGSNMAIDAGIWIIQTTGQIFKYTRGVKDGFVLTDLDKPFASGSVIYTNADVEKLYVLDRTNGRIVVMDKTGSYQAEYRWDQAQSATDLVVDEKGGQMYLLVGSKIWASKL